MGNHKTFWPWMLLLMISMTVSGEFSVTKYSSRREELSLLKNLLKVLEQLVKDQSTKMEKIGGELHAINKKMPNDIGGNKKDIMDNISSVPIEIKRQDAAIINLEIKQQLFESNLKDIVRESKEIASNVTSIAVENEIQNASITQHEEKQESLERKLKDLESESKEIASNVTSIAVENEIQNASITQHEEKQQSLERKLNDLESESKEIMNNIRSLKTKSERQDATIAQYYVKQLSLERELIDNITSLATPGTTKNNITRGGTAFLIRNNSDFSVKDVQTTNERIMGIEITYGSNQLFIIGCLLPSTNHHYEEYKRVMQDLFDLFDELSETGPVIFCGDFNTDIKNKTGSPKSKLLTENTLDRNLCSIFSTGNQIEHTFQTKDKKIEGIEVIPP
ncbi:uncharacterized protein LOC134249572 [Saccostrea cucullata]|uniref:uncharacterized protein LOC134249572 n=1 Tax=Saccostrea cuccullata TaxID=36930 RepID=UPI002ED6BEDD